MIIFWLCFDHHLHKIWSELKVTLRLLQGAFKAQCLIWSSFAQNLIKTKSYLEVTLLLQGAFKAQCLIWSSFAQKLVKAKVTLRLLQGALTAPYLIIFWFGFDPFLHKILSELKVTLKLLQGAFKAQCWIVIWFWFDHHLHKIWSKLKVTLRLLQGALTAPDCRTARFGMCLVCKF